MFLYWIFSCCLQIADSVFEKVTRLLSEISLNALKVAHAGQQAAAAKRSSCPLPTASKVEWNPGTSDGTASPSNTVIWVQQDHEKKKSSVLGLQICAFIHRAKPVALCCVRTENTHMYSVNCMDLKRKIEPFVPIVFDSVNLLTSKNKSKADNCGRQRSCATRGGAGHRVHS